MLQGQRVAKVFELKQVTGHINVGVTP